MKMDGRCYWPFRSRLSRPELSPDPLPPTFRQSSRVPTLVPNIFVRGFREVAARSALTSLEPFSKACCFVSLITDISLSPFLVGVSAAVTQHCPLGRARLRNLIVTTPADRLSSDLKTPNLLRAPLRLRGSCDGPHDNSLNVNRHRHVRAG